MGDVESFLAIARHDFLLQMLKKRSDVEDEEGEALSLHMGGAKEGRPRVTFSMDDSRAVSTLVKI